jgi:hypothetical protein
VTLVGCVARMKRSGMRDLASGCESRISPRSTRATLPIALAALLLAACSSTPPPPPAGTTTTVGGWEVTTGGRVSVDGGVVN